MNSNKLKQKLTFPHSGLRITTSCARLFLDVVASSTTPPTQGVRLIVPFSKTGGTLRLKSETIDLLVLLPSKLHDIVCYCMGFHVTVKKYKIFQITFLHSKFSFYLHVILGNNLIMLSWCLISSTSYFHHEVHNRHCHSACMGISY